MSQNNCAFLLIPKHSIAPPSPSSKTRLRSIGGSLIAPSFTPNSDRAFPSHPTPDRASFHIPTPDRATPSHPKPRCSKATALQGSR